ncbi:MULTISPECIES: ATP-binding protein [Streptomyces]|uniref:ATP-binding protein n=1 Tax=Streptomyces luteosporeus TaxID=173856 RepID=A0ABN3TW67_9ACTN
MASVSLCPVVHPAVPDVAEHVRHASIQHRDPYDLAYSYAIPGEPHAVAVARAGVLRALEAHGLGDLVPPALQATGELVACAALFEPGQVLYLSLRWRREVEGVCITLWDPHSGHSEADGSARCAARRNRMLYLLACVVHECKGKWGVIRPAPGREGTKVWVNLPRAGAADYAAAIA